METNRAAFGIFRNQEQIKRAVTTLMAQGFRASGILEISPGARGRQDFAYELRTMIREGSVTGIIVGAVIGTLLSMIFLPGIGFVILGLVLGGALGAASGALIGIGTPESAAQRYVEYMNDGGILLSVHLDNEIQYQLATEILAETGATDITTTNEESTLESVFKQIQKVGRQCRSLRGEQILQHAVRVRT